MASPSLKVLQLRQLLAERFGHAEREGNEKVYSTHFPALDEVGIPQGALTEIVAEPALGPGGALLLYGLLHAVTCRGERAILIDGKDAFAPKGLSQAELNQLLWIRCHESWEVIKAADLAVRDGNIPLVVLLLTLNPAAELRRIPSTAWHRLQMLAEKSAVALLVFTPQAQIGCARLRLSVGGAFPLEALHRCREKLFPDLMVQIERRRMNLERKDDEELRRVACS